MSVGLFRVSRRNLDKLLLTLGSPRESIFQSRPVDSVTVPGTEGYFTLTQGHSQTISMLRPGVITVREGALSTEFFVSDGFAFFGGGNKAEISGVEVVPVAALDKEKAIAMITELQSGSKDTDWDRVKVQLGVNMLNQVIKFAQ